MVYKLPHVEAKPPKLNPGNVPEDCWVYIPLAEKYGIADDGYRIDVISGLDNEEKTELAEFLSTYPESLDNWLCGSESKSTEPSQEYIAFTALIMAADYAQE